MLIITTACMFKPIERKYNFRKIPTQYITAEDVKKANEQIIEACEYEGPVMCQIAKEYAYQLSQEYEKKLLSQENQDKSA